MISRHGQRRAPLTSHTILRSIFRGDAHYHCCTCLLYTSDAADEEDSGDLGGLRIIKKKKTEVKSIGTLY